MFIPPSFTDIAYFLEIADTRNISRAAERLGITQPGLSTAMKRLESALESHLFIRNRTGVQLTRTGKELQAKGRMLLLNWEQLKSDMGKAEREIGGRYTIGCHPSVALYALPRFLPELIWRHPQLEIKLHHGLSRKIVESVISFEIDLGIVANPVGHPDLVIRNLYRDEIKFLALNRPSPTQTLDPHQGVLICDLNLAQVQKLLGDLRRKKLGFKRVIQSSNLEVIAELTAAGVGIGMLPLGTATIAKGQKLRVLDEQLPSFKDTICLVYRADYQKSEGSKAIIKAIRQAAFGP